MVTWKLKPNMPDIKLCVSSNLTVKHDQTCEFVFLFSGATGSVW